MEIPHLQTGPSDADPWKNGVYWEDFENSNDV